MQNKLAHSEDRRREGHCRAKVLRCLCEQGIIERRRMKRGTMGELGWAESTTAEQIMMRRHLHTPAASIGAGDWSAFLRHNCTAQRRRLTSS